MSVRRWVVAGLLLVAGLAALVLGLERVGGPLPSRPADFEALDPLVQERLEEELAAVREHRRSPAAWRRLAAFEEANGLFGAAERAYEQALVLGPGDAQALHRLACVLERTGDLERAAQTMARATEAEPYYPASWWWLAWWRLDLGELEAAEAALAHARALAPEAPAVRLVAVRLALARRSPAEAAALLDAELLAGPSAPYAHHLLAQALRQQGDLDGAERAAARADGRRPVFADRWSAEVQALETGYAALRLRAGRDLLARRFAEAEEKLRAILAHDPADARSWNMLATCRLELGDAAGAVEHAERVLALDPASREGAINLGRALLRSSPREPARLAEALDHAQALVVARPEDAGAWRVRASLAEALGRTDEALAALDAAAALEPEATDLRLQAAFVELKASRFEPALKRLQALQTTHPELDEAWFGAALTLLQAGRLEEARAALETLETREGVDAARVAQLRAALAQAQAAPGQAER